MNLSPTTLVLFLLAFGFFIFIRLWKRKNRFSPLQGKQISIKGFRVVTPLFTSIPLPCLLADGTNYGEDFQSKEEPTLPHCEGCKCKKVDISLGNRDWFSGKEISFEVQSTVGSLKGIESRYYKYFLVLHHKNLPQEGKKHYSELLEKIQVSPAFKERIQNSFSQDKNE